MTAGRSKQDEALVVAEQLLGEIELGKIEPVAVVRKAGRLARLIDDVEAMDWLSYETTGYPPKTLDPKAWMAAERSCRIDESGTHATTTSLGRLAIEMDGALAELSSSGGEVSDSDYAVVVERAKAERLKGLRMVAANRRQLLDNVLGAVHQYVADRFQELRFGSATETAFAVVRQEVDGAISGLVPDLLPMISAAFENASSDNPEHWQSAAATCRRLLMTAADRLRPPGPEVDGRKMGQGNYVNRLVDWILNQAASETSKKMIVADLNYLGPRLDAADAAGQKGAHVGDRLVTRLEASRYVTGTYLVLGDILRVRDIANSAVTEVVGATVGDEDSTVASKEGIRGPDDD